MVPEGEAEATVSPSPLEGEGARRAGEGSARGYAKSLWRTPLTNHLRGYAKAMRHQPTEAEARLWSLLRNRRFVDFKFRRQLPIGSYIADLVCVSAKLIIEADGSQHADDLRDIARDAYLRGQGFRLLRLWNNDILAEPDAIMDAVWAALQELQ